MVLPPLPVDEVLPELVSTMAQNRVTVLQAPPGAGKTTRVPLALLNAPFLNNGSILMLEPRRLAAMNAARWMASLLGEEVGGSVGYRVRFDSAVSPRTRIEVVTEGILLRRLQADPLLEGVGTVVFDEFHERNLDADVSLAITRDIVRGLRGDLRILIMSATLDGETLAQALDAPLIRSAGREWPVEIRYLERDPDRDPAKAATTAVLAALRETAGDILVFLPGAGEIRRALSLLQESKGSSDILFLPLYGDLSYDQQERAILPAPRRKVVLATNIAETSLTISGIGVVIDAGFARQVRHDPSSGISKMMTSRISAASADQRAGRAGRLGPGCCFRLWTRHVQATLVPFAPPEILVSDLSPLALQLAGWGVRAADELPWIDPPPAAQLEEGKLLLLRLGALDFRGHLTPFGREMLLLPVHPRIGALLLVARAEGVGDAGCDLAALLSERDIVRRGREPNVFQEFGVSGRLEILRRWRVREPLPESVDPAACRAVDRVSSQLRRVLKIERDLPLPEEELLSLLLARAYPDRIGRRRAPGSERFLLSGGRGARLPDRSSLGHDEFIVAPVVEGEEGGDAVVRLAAAVSAQGLRSACADAVVTVRTVEWSEAEQRISGREEERIGVIPLSTRQVKVTDREAVPLLLELLKKPEGVGLLGWTRDAEQFRGRVAFLARVLPEESFPDFRREFLPDGMEEWLAPFLSGVRSRQELGAVNMLRPLQGRLTTRQLRIVEEEAPAYLQVPSGSRIAIDYASGDSPVLAVKLQELFGLAESPRLGRGREGVVLHLLSPAGRPVQVTRDLKSFWDNGYLQVRKELRGRYPKHPWPDDPWNAAPTRHARRRR